MSCAVGFGIYRTAFRNSAFLLVGGQQAGVHGQKGYAVRPAQGQHAETTGIAMTYMVKDLCQKFHLFRTLALEKCVIHNEHIPALVRCERGNGIGNDFGRE